MSTETNKTEDQDLSPVVRAIGTDLEHTQVRVIASANADMLFHYWKVGHFILYLQKKEAWGSKVIDNLSKAIRSKYPDKKGYSTRNLIYMCQFAKAYPMEVLTEMSKAEELLNSPSADNVLQQTRKLNQFTQEPLAQIQATANQGDIITQQPVALLAEVSETLSEIYRRDIRQIEDIFKHSAIVRTNWASHVILLNSKLPLGERFWYITQAVANGWSSNVLQMQIETNLFARQITSKKVSNFSARLPKPQSDLANYLMKDPYIFDMMGQLNFYINVVEDTLRGEHDNKTIGLLLCNGGDKVVAQYALSGYDQPIGVSDYQLSKAIPDNLKSALPTVKEELSKIVDKNIYTTFDDELISVRTIE